MGTRLYGIWRGTFVQASHFCLVEDMSSILSSNFEAFASELLENLKEIFPRYNGSA